MKNSTKKEKCELCLANGIDIESTTERSFLSGNIPVCDECAQEIDHIRQKNEGARQ